MKHVACPPNVLLKAHINENTANSTQKRMICSPLLLFLFLYLNLHSTINTKPGIPYHLNGNIILDGNVRSFKISPNGTHVVYLGDQDVFDQYELFAWHINYSKSVCFPIKSAENEIVIVCMCPFYVDHLL